MSGSSASSSSAAGVIKVRRGIADHRKRAGMAAGTRYLKTRDVGYIGQYNMRCGDVHDVDKCTKSGVSHFPKNAT